MLTDGRTSGDVGDRLDKSGVAAPASAPCVGLTGKRLTIDEILSVAYQRAPVVLDLSSERRERFEASRVAVKRAVTAGQVVYGVTTGFGGMADQRVGPDAVSALQHRLLDHLHTGMGAPLPVPVVKAAMLVRINSHLRGVSGLRWELVQRLARFLNEGVTPVVLDLGSIGASGDLVPLAAIAGAAIGAHGYRVHWQDGTHSAQDVLDRLGLPTLRFEPKEGLAMINGTSASTAWGIDVAWRARRLFAATLMFHALAFVALGGDPASLDAFVHQHKPHWGQRWVAATMRRALAGIDERYIATGHDGLAQDRYSLRCLSQFLGPVVDTIERVLRDLETEANSATDNPLFDGASGRWFHSGNFLAQYVGVGMDNLRAQVALMVNHTDVQLAQLMTPAFSNGLPASLVGNTAKPQNMGLKGLQIVANSIAPLVDYHATPLANRFPTHAEQHNQNINAQSFGSARLATTQLDLARHHLACALLAVVQAVRLRGAPLSPALSRVAEAVSVAAGQPDVNGPLVRDDGDQVIEHMLAGVVAALEPGETIDHAVTMLPA